MLDISPNLVAFNKDGTPRTIRYAFLQFPHIKQTQKHHVRITQLEESVRSLTETVLKQDATIKTMEKMLQNLLNAK